MTFRSQFLFPLAHMHRLIDVFPHRPRMVGEVAGLSRSRVLQTGVRLDPIVPVSPQRQRMTQVVRFHGTVASATRQASLLTAKRSIEPFDMRGVDLSAGTIGFLGGKQRGRGGTDAGCPSTDPGRLAL